MTPRSESIDPSDLIDRCYDLYRDEYLKAFPSGGDVHDHDEAVHAAVSAVVVEVLSATGQLKHGMDRTGG